MTEINDMSNAVARTLDHAAASVHSAVDRTTDAARPAVDHLVDGVHQAVDKLVGAANMATKTLDAKGEQLALAQSRLTKTCRTYVQEKPLTSLGIAVASGFLLSWALRQR
jgi:ElaB/YqjD/DUF883 family membrane-anchored ribosome-binding protein